MYQLERYKGSFSRHNCPNCGTAKAFVRYINDQGEYIDNGVGRCNRESNCGYHFTPKQYFEAQGVRSFVREQYRALERSNASNTQTPEHFDTIDNSFILRSLEYTPKNRFLNFLRTFIDDYHIEEILKNYFVGTTKDGKTVFWMIDKNGNARTGKIIDYNEVTGKRNKEINPTWIHYELKRHKLLPENFQHKLCFFGEHLIKKTAKPIAIVEAEKTAVIAHLFIDDFLWLAIGAKSYLKAEKLLQFKNRKIVLFPDADAFDLWSAEAARARRFNINVSVSEIINQAATEEEKLNGFDLADYLIRSELHAQKWNWVADAYNSKVDLILSDKKLLEYFDEILDERLAIMEMETATPEIVRDVVNGMTIVKSPPPNEAFGSGFKPVITQRS